MQKVLVIRARNNGWSWVQASLMLDGVVETYKNTVSRTIPKRPTSPLQSRTLDDPDFYEIYQSLHNTEGFKQTIILHPQN